MRYDDQLALVREKMARKEQLKSILAELDKQRRDLALRVEELEWVKLREEYDVAKVEGKSFASFFASLLGTKGKKLEKEKAEALAATLKYENARYKLEQVKADILYYEDEANSLLYVKEEYERLLQKKRDAIKATGSADGEEILATEQKLSYLKHQKKEICEARLAGEKALEIAEKICQNLGSAKGFGYADLIGGGSMVDLFKYDQLNRAQSRVEALQNALRSFQTELADIRSITVEADFRVGDFLQTADFFFDCIFVDWDVYAQIKENHKDMTATRDQIKEAIARLDFLEQSNAQQTEELNARLRVLEGRNSI